MGRKEIRYKNILGLVVLPYETDHAVLLNIRNIDIIKEKSQGKRAGLNIQPKPYFF